jgi:hypothetical protein
VGYTGPLHRPMGGTQGGSDMQRKEDRAALGALLLLGERSEPGLGSSVYNGGSHSASQPCCPMVPCWFPERADPSRHSEKVPIGSHLVTCVNPA